MALAQEMDRPYVGLLSATTGSEREGRRSVATSVYGHRKCLIFRQTGDGKRPDDVRARLADQ